MNADEAEKQGIKQAEFITVTQDDNTVQMIFEIDNTIADGCIYLATGIEQTSTLGAAFSNVSVKMVDGVENHD